MDIVMETGGKYGWEMCVYYFKQGLIKNYRMKYEKILLMVVTVAIMGCNQTKNLEQMKKQILLIIAALFFMSVSAHIFDMLAKTPVQLFE